MRCVINALAAVIVCLAAGCQTAGREGKQSLTSDDLPSPVRRTLDARFPGAEVRKVTKEREAGREMYDVEMRHEGVKKEMDVFADGTIHNWERQIPPAELPAAVANAAELRYPKATIREAMAVTEVKDGKDRLEGYEIVLRTGEGKSVEIMVAPDGRILEDAPAGE